MVEKKSNVDSDGRTKAAVSNKRLRRANRGTDVEVAEYAGVDSKRLQQAIASIAARGCAVQFSYTRDGSAYCVRIVGDGEPYNEYIRPTEDFDLYLAGLIEDFQPGGI